MLYDKSIKNCKGEDKMNTKDYIENKKSKKLSNILKGALATGLVVGSMITSTACKPNQPHESTSTTNSSTSTIETTTTTQQTTTETPSTTETTKIDEPIIRTDEKAEELKAMIDAYYDEDVEPKYRRIKIACYRENKETSYAFEIRKIIDEDLNTIKIDAFDISEEEYEYIKDIYEKISGSGDISGISAFQLSLNYIIKNFDDKTFDILMNAILSKQSTNQSSQDDLVR